MSRFSQFTGGSSGGDLPGVIVSTLNNVTLPGYLKLDGTCYTSTDYPDLAAIMGPPVATLNDTITVTPGAVSCWCEICSGVLKWGPSNPGVYTLFFCSSNQCCYMVRTITGDGTCRCVNFSGTCCRWCNPCMASAWFNGCGYIGVSGQYARYNVINMCTCCLVANDLCLGHAYDSQPYYNGHSWLDCSFFVDSWAATNSYCHNMMYLCPCASDAGICAKCICGCSQLAGTFLTGSSSYNGCVHCVCMTLFDDNDQQCGLFGRFGQPNGTAYNCCWSCCVGRGLILPFTTNPIQACFYNEECHLICCCLPICATSCCSGYGQHLGRLSDTSAIFTRHTYNYVARSGYSTTSYSTSAHYYMGAWCYTINSNTIPCVGYTAASTGCATHENYVSGGSINGFGGAFVSTDGSYLAVAKCYSPLIGLCYGGSQTVGCSIISGTSWPIANSGTTTATGRMEAWGGLKANFVSCSTPCISGSEAIFYGAAVLPDNIFKINCVSHPSTGLAYFIKT